MTQQEYQQYQQLARLVYYLQLEAWPLEKPNKPTALAEVIKIAQVLGINIDYADPQFLPAVAKKIAEILIKPTEPPPQNIDFFRLKEWERELEAAKQKIKVDTTKILFPTTNKQIQNLVKIYQQKITEVLKSSEPILNQLPPEVREEISQKTVVKNIDNLPVSPEVLSPEGYQKIIQEKFIPTIKEELTRWGMEKTQIETQKETIVKKLVTQTYEPAKTLTATFHKTIPIATPPITPEIISSPPIPLPTEENLKYKKLLNEVKKTISLAGPEIKGKELDLMTKNATDEIIVSLPVVVQKDFLSEEDKKQIVFQSQAIIQKGFQQVGKEPQNKIDIQPLIQQIQPVMEPKFISIFKETKLKEILPLPKTVLAKLNQATETIYPLPAYTHLNPKAVSGFFIKKTANRPSARLIEFAVKNAPPEWQASKNWPIIQEMVEKRIFAEYLQKNVNFFKKAGVPANHPLIQQFEDKIAKLLEVQKNPKTGQDHNWVKILKKDSTDWSQGFNRFRSIVNTYERFSKFVTKGNYVPFLTPVRQFFYKKITQPIVGWLAKTAVGKAAQQGAKKAATWIAAKLGMKLAVTAGIAAAGAATGPPGWVVAAVTIGLDILKALGKKIIGFVKRIIQEPDKALGSIGVGVLLLILIPSPLKLIAILPLAVGGLGLMTFIAAPATLGVIGGGVSAFFIAIAAIPIAAPIALFIIILFSSLAGLTLFIVLVVSGAFILPSKVAEVTPTTISPYESPYFELKKTADPAIMDNILPGNNAEITYKITITAKDKKLTIIGSINEEISLSTNGNPSKPQAHSFDEDLQEKGREINPGGTWEVEYSINVDSSFNDTAIINTVHVELAADEVAGRLPGTTSASVIIGEPPGDCPDSIRWPTCGIYTQGPWGIASHWPHGEEAIDIHNADGTAIYATHNGTATLRDQDGTGAGHYVIITGSCQGTQFQTWYMHMRETGRASGKVVKGQIIGYMSNSGTGGVHLHYEFRTGDGARRWPYGGAPGVYTDNKTIPSFPPLMPMAPPYIPFALDRVSVVITDENGNTSGVTIQPTFGSCLIKSVYSP